MAIKVICAWCGEWMGLKPSNGDLATHEPVSHSICCTCKKKVLDETEQFLNQTTDNHNKKSDRKEIVK